MSMRSSLSRSSSLFCSAKAEARFFIAARWEAKNMTEKRQLKYKFVGNAAI